MLLFLLVHFVVNRIDGGFIGLFNKTKRLTLFSRKTISYAEVEMKKRRKTIVFLLFCTPAGARTLDPLIKSQMLYQLSYKRVAHPYFSNASAKVGIIFQTAKCFSKYFQCFLLLKYDVGWRWFGRTA